MRDRIWWSLRIHDAWVRDQPVRSSLLALVDASGCAQASFLNSRPSHIQAGNTNVPLLPFPTPSDGVEAYVGSVAFQYSCRLAVIVARLQSEVSTLDKYGSATRAESCDELEQELNAMKDGARPFLDMSPRPIGMGVSRSLLASVPTSHARSPRHADALLFKLLALRCMVRRISIEVRIGLGNTFAPDGSTLEIFAQLVDFYSSLGAQSFGNGRSWLPCASLSAARWRLSLESRRPYEHTADVSHILSSVLSSLIRLSLAAISSKYSTPSSTAHSGAPSHHLTPPPTVSSAAVHLLARLAFAVHRARSEYDWSLADAALDRAASVAERLTAAMQADAACDDYSEVVAALQGQVTPEPTSSAASSASAGAGAPFDALNALATVAERPSGAAAASGDALGGPFEAQLGFFGGVGHASSASVEDFATEAFDLPDLEAWLNILDRAPAWGADESRSNGGVSW